MTITTNPSLVRTTPAPMSDAAAGAGDQHLGLRVFAAGLERMAGRDGAGQEGIITAREALVLIAVYTDDEPQTVRGLAKRFGLSKPAITRALDRLCELDLARRQRDPDDGRSVIVQRTQDGRRWMRGLDNALSIAAARGEG